MSHSQIHISRRIESYDCFPPSGPNQLAPDDTPSTVTTRKRKRESEETSQTAPSNDAAVTPEKSVEPVTEAGKLCRDFGLNDVDLEFSRHDYDVVDSYDLFQQAFKHRLAGANPKVNIQNVVYCCLEDAPLYITHISYRLARKSCHCWSKPNGQTLSRRLHLPSWQERKITRVPKINRSFRM